MKVSRKGGATSVSNDDKSTCDRLACVLPALTVQHFLSRDGSYTGSCVDGTWLASGSASRYEYQLSIHALLGVRNKAID